MPAITVARTLQANRYKILTLSHYLVSMVQKRLSDGHYLGIPAGLCLNHRIEGSDKVGKLEQPVWESGKILPELRMGYLETGPIGSCPLGA